MKNLNVPQPLSGGSPASRFQAAKAMAFTLATTDPELIESELEGCSGPYGWRDYDISHDRLEVDVGGKLT